MTHETQKTLQTIFGTLALSIFALMAFGMLQADAEEPLTFNPKLPKLKIEFPVVYDVKKVCKAIAVAETSGCTDGTARSRNNCHGIMAWDANRRRYPRYFKSKEDSFKECERIWDRYYGDVPNKDNFRLADKWTGGDNTWTWIKNFTTAYNSL